MNCLQSIDTHFCQIIQLPDHPPHFYSPRLKKIVQIMAIWYLHNLISSVLKNWFVQILLNSAQIQNSERRPRFWKKSFCLNRSNTHGHLDQHRFSSDKMKLQCRKHSRREGWVIYRCNRLVMLYFTGKFEWPHSSTVWVIVEKWILRWNSERRPRFWKKSIFLKSL